MKSKLLVLLVLFAGVALSFSVSAKPQPASGQGWQETQKTDSRGGTPYTQYTLAGRFVKRPHGEVSAPPSLVMNCELGKNSRFSRAGFQSGLLRAGAAMKIEFVEPQEIHGTSYYQKVNVRYRLDEGKPEHEQWTPSPEKTSASLPKEALKKMLGARTVLITVIEDSAGEVEMEFDMADSAKVAQACGLPIHKK